MDRTKEILYLEVRSHRMLKDYYYEQAKRSRRKEYKDKYTSWADMCKHDENVVINLIVMLYGKEYKDTLADIEKFIADYNQKELDSCIARCKKFINLARSGAVKLDFQDALDSYNDMKLISGNVKLDTEEYRACKAEFEQTFEKELSKRKRCAK